ncbi:hypothetical protein SLH46_11210 [Draconibacterium sp. IB214405]|uniref:hypothetical protein n=1 Tax=Draconibacterium sp. IB214405 TaxID=3097352 RepID=UPI002A0E71E9|nr:hypothetical protein [Draconibacterium sp. IB214405]MDX8339755.1 hypothetical protein [Draconibacterium sp. IB214405]
MESTNRFDLITYVDQWLELNCQNDEFLPEDVLQIKSDLLSSIDDIIDEFEVSEEDAFGIACERMGSRFEWQGEMKQVNEDNFQLKKVVLLFGGVIFYIFSYHFILSLNRLVLLMSIAINGNIADNVANSSTFFNLVYFITISGLAAVYFWHKPIKILFSRITASTTLNVIIVIATLASVVLELYLGPKVKLSIEDIYSNTLFFNKEITFKYMYFCIFLIGYILLFKKYTKKFYM